MISDWRFLVYYPLGLLPSIFFSLRFLIQWIRSEKRKESYVEPLFWKLSLAGNVLLFIHYFIQVQYPFALLQAGNAIIAWRNLNLMQSVHPISFKAILGIFITALGLVIAACILQNIWLLGNSDWMRIPLGVDNSKHTFLVWGIMGCLGQGLFSSRFWIQWWQAESRHKSELTRLFWWISLTGSLLSLIYFTHINDVISLINHSFGLVPYMRNLVLIYKKRNVPAEAMHKAN